MGRESSVTRRSLAACVSSGIAVVLLRAISGCGPSAPVEPAEYKKSEKYKELHPEEFATPAKKGRKRAR